MKRRFFYDHIKKIEEITIFKYLKKILLRFLLNIQKINVTYPKIFQGGQLTLIYIFPLIELIYSTLSNVYAIGYFPEVLKPVFPLFFKMFTSSFFNFLGNPDQAFLISYVAMELFLVHEIFHLSSFVKYHLILANSVLMLQNLIVGYWDFLYNREVFVGVSQWALDDGIFLESDPFWSAIFFLNIFFLFFFLYIYLYIAAIRNKFITFPYINWLTDSAAFWVRVKTPTMQKKKVKKF